MGESLEGVLATLMEKLGHWSGKINEAQTSQVIVLRLLMALGWDIWDPEEVKAQDTSNKDRPDFLLNVNGEPALVLEVKALGKPATDGDRTQVVNYANSQNIRWAVLTTGREWEFFDNKKEAKAHEKRVLLLRIDDRSQWKYLEGMLSRSFWGNPKHASEELGDRAPTMQKEIEKNETLSRIRDILIDCVKEGNAYQPNEKGLLAAIKNELSDDEKELALKEFPRLLKEVLGKEPREPTKEEILEILRDFLFRSEENNKTKFTPDFKVEFNENVLQDESEKWVVIDSITTWRNLYYKIVDCLYKIESLYADPPNSKARSIINHAKTKTRDKVEDKTMYAYRKLSSSEEFLFIHYNSKEIMTKLEALLKGLKRELLQLQTERPILRIRYKEKSGPLEVVY